MTSPNWKDIQDRAEKIVFDYKDAKDEDRDAKPFWKDLMQLYGVEARSIGAFEERVRMYGRPGVGKMDYFAPRKFLIEQKSRGKDLDAAYEQALYYFDSLASEIRPRHIIVSDFARIRVYNLEKDESERATEFFLEDLPNRVHELGFFADEEVRVFKPEEHIDVRAVRVIGKLHKALKDSYYPTEDLPRLLTRLVFCFFADDIGIFEKNVMRRYLEENTREDGADVGDKLHNIFETLDTPDGTAGSKNERQTGMIDVLRALPWVNGGMFKGHVRLLQGTRDIRNMLIECMAFDWSQVSPAIFGSMFQSVMNKEERHDLGAHYTSETNIKKVINGLFLEDFQHELSLATTNKAKLEALWEKIANVSLLDPACGCGNFLVISYRELRTIENEIIRRLHGKADKRAVTHADTQGRLGLEKVDLQKISRLSVERMYGIELDPFPVEVAKLSLWLVDHKMNIELGRIFGEHLVKLPLREQPHIVHGNALRTDWESVVPKDRLSYILGNPPFLGKKEQDEEQKKDMEAVWGDEKGTGVLDYVTCWYKKAADFIEGTRIPVAFVSTNSITQGEQVGVLWPWLLSRGIKIHFAHRTFRWSNEATGKAAVHCVIVGFAAYATSKPVLCDETCTAVANINPYLVDAPDVVVQARRGSLIANVPDASYGSFALDDGIYTLSADDRAKILAKYPDSEKYIREFVGGQELIHNEKRYCLWLVDAKPEEIRSWPEIARLVDAVRQWRLLSNRETTKKLAATPFRFAEIRQPATDYIAFPTLSSENRNYIPIAMLKSAVIASNQVYVIPTSGMFVFGVLTSTMHNAWIRAVCGRLESRYRYSVAIVYNNFPWPEKPTEEQRNAVEVAAQAVLDARSKYPTSTLADLYDPNTMPADLLKAHHDLDRAVDACYGKKSFKSEPERLEFLFELYKKYIDAQPVVIKKSRKKRVAA